MRLFDFCEDFYRTGHDDLNESKALGCFLRKVGSDIRARVIYERTLALYGWTVPSTPRT